MRRPQRGCGPPVVRRYRGMVSNSVGQAQLDILRAPPDPPEQGGEISVAVEGFAWPLDLDHRDKRIQIRDELAGVAIEFGGWVRDGCALTPPPRGTTIPSP